jgi:hypothetical protein
MFCEQEGTVWNRNVKKKIVFYYRFLQLSYVIGIVFIEWSWHTHSAHWQNVRSALLSLALGKIEITWVQNGPVPLET